MIVEVCSSSLEGIKNASKAGADRIELCSALELGGVTPSRGFIEAAVGLTTLDIHCLIRPRAGHFTYSEDESKIIEKDIIAAAEIGCKGVVLGALTTEFTLDTKRLKHWKKLADTMYLTFHRAMDVVVDPKTVIKQLIDLGFNCILSSGQEEKAMDGLHNLNEWREDFGKDILIMPGSGINKTNCEVFKASGFSALHLSGSKPQSLISIPTGINNTISFLHQPLSVSDRQTIHEVVLKVKS